MGGDRDCFSCVDRPRNTQSLTSSSNCRRNHAMNDKAVPQPEIAQTGARRAPSSALAAQPTRPVPLSLRVLFGAAVALSVVAGAAVLADLAALRRTSAQLDQFRVIQGTLERLQSTLVDAEAGERGYLLTGRAVYLEPYVSATTIYPTLLADLERLAGR